MLLKYWGYNPFLGFRSPRNPYSFAMAVLKGTFNIIITFDEVGVSAF